MAAAIGRALLLCALGSAPLFAADSVETTSPATIRGIVEANGEPTAGATVRAYGYKLTLETTTDGEGRYSFEIPTKPRDQRPGLVLIAESKGGELGYYRTPFQAEELAAECQIPLRPATQLSVRVVDAQGEPISGARVAAQSGFRLIADELTEADGEVDLRLPADATLQSVFAVKPGAGFDYGVASTFQSPEWRPEWLKEGEVTFRLDGAREYQVRVLGPEGEPLTETPINLWLLTKPGEQDSFNSSGLAEPFTVETDSSGVARFDFVPSWQQNQLTLWCHDDRFVRRRITIDPSDPSAKETQITLTPTIPVRGRVLLPDGQPAEGIEVAGRGAGYEMDNFHGSTKTDAEGRFELQAYPHELLMLVVNDQEWAAAAIDGLITKPNQPIESLEFKLQQATRVFGRVTVGPDREPVQLYVNLTQQARDLQAVGGELPKPDDPDRQNLWIGSNFYRSAQTEEDGSFEFFVGPGEYTLGGPSQVESQKFTVAGESQLEFNFHSPRKELGTLTGRVVTGDPPRGVAGVTVRGVYLSHRVHRRDIEVVTDENGEFRVERALHPATLYARSGEKDSDEQLAGMVDLGADDKEVTLAIGPTASFTARLVDPITGQPEAGVKLTYSVSHSLGDGISTSRFGGSTTTDDDGQLAGRGLVIGRKYGVVREVREGGSTRYYTLASLTPTESQAYALGDVTKKLPGGLTFEQLVARELDPKKSAMKNYERATKLAAGTLESFLVVFLDEGTPDAKQWFAVQYSYESPLNSLGSHRKLIVSTTARDAAKLADKLGVAFITTPRPIVCICSPRGETLATISGDELMSDSDQGEKQIDAQKLADFLKEYEVVP